MKLDVVKIIECELSRLRFVTALLNALFERFQCTKNATPVPARGHIRLFDLERIVLWWYLLLEVVTEDGNLLHDVRPHARNV